MKPQEKQNLLQKHNLEQFLKIRTQTNNNEETINNRSTFSIDNSSNICTKRKG